MVSSELLQSEGWCLSPKGLSLISENGSLTALRAILDKALNTDLKDIGRSVLNEELKKDEINKLVLQVQKVRNLSAPKANQDSQAAPRMLRLILSDGYNTCQAIEVAEVPKLSHRNTAPGTKILIKNAKVLSGCITLHSKNCTVLGGIVPVLYEKWEITKNIDAERRTSNIDGPPPWVNFGEKIIYSESSGDFKSLASKTTREASKEFEEQRQGAIAELGTGAIKKVFGGGIKGNNLNRNDQSNYNQKRDSKWENRNSRDNEKGPRGRKDNRDKEEKIQQTKPSEKMSLFDFLEDKLPSTVEKDIQTNNTTLHPVSQYNNQGQNNRNHDSYQQRPPRFQQHQRQNNGYDRTQTKYNDESNKSKSKSYDHNPYKIEQEWYRNDKIYQNRTKTLSSESSTVHENPQKAPKNTKTATMTEYHQTSQQNYYSNNNKKNASIVPEGDLETKVQRMSLNSQYVTRSLKQHLNIFTDESSSNNNFKKPNHDKLDWKIGDQCMAKYWEDKKYYNATVVNLSDRTCVVRFNGYGNVEEVLKTDCLPITEERREGNFQNRPPYQGPPRNQRTSQTYYSRKT